MAATSAISRRLGGAAKEPLDIGGDARKTPLVQAAVQAVRRADPQWRMAT